MNLDTIIAELKYFETGVFPRQALKEAIARPDEITPVLLDTLENATNDISLILDDPSYNLHTYAFFLLAQFRETKAYPLILKLFSLPDVDPYDFAGDLITEDLGRVLASVYDGDPEPAKQVFKSNRVNEYVRSAVSDMFLSLVIEDVMSREEVLEHYQECLASLALDTANDGTVFARSALITDMLSLGPEQPWLDSITTAFQNNLIDTFYISQEDVQTFKKRGIDGCLQELKERKQYRMVRDTIAETEWWYCFQEPKAPEAPKAPPKRLDPREIQQLTARRSTSSYPSSSKKKSKSKKSPLREAQGFSSPSRKKSSKKKKGF